MKGLLGVQVPSERHLVHLKQNTIMQHQTIKTMSWLRERCRTIRTNNLKISEWVDEYIDGCVLHGKPVEILTQYCLSKDLEHRYKIQGDCFVALAAELEMFQRNMPAIISMFNSNGIMVNWYVTLNNSFLDRGRVSNEITELYFSMLSTLLQNEEIMLLNWEKDILGKRPEANLEVLNNFENLISKQAFERDLQNLIQRSIQHNVTKNETELRPEARFKIACEAEEGRFIFSAESPFSKGNILITPLEFPERLLFFETLAPDFKKRIVPILKLYPWRMDEINLNYE